MRIQDLQDSIKDPTAANRPIRLRLAGERGPLQDPLLVKHVSGSEAMFDGLEYRLLCVSETAGLPLKQFNAMAVELQFVTDRGDLRLVCGIVSHVEEGASDGGLATYQLVVKDALSLMEGRVNTRVFRNASEIDVTRTLLGEWIRNNPVLARSFDFTLKTRSCPAREFTMQHNESDAAFLRRLWKRRGLAWFIRPEKMDEPDRNQLTRHQLVICDDSYRFTRNSAGVVRFHRDDATETSDSITAWHARRWLTPGRVTRYSADYKQMAQQGEESSRNQQGKFGNLFAASLEEYIVDAPHTGTDIHDYVNLTARRMQHHEYAAKSFDAESGVRALCVGEWIDVAGHPEIDRHAPDERAFVVTALHVDAENNLPKALDDKITRLFAANRWHDAGPGLAQASAERGMRYANRFTCIRRGIPVVPAYDPRIDLPRTELQSVVVVGPQNEEVYCDELGRVKVRFPACRPADHAHAQGVGASGSDTDSAWVRVASPWAGNQYGAISLPRVGDECLVAFLGGDPDKPLIIGRVHGNATRPPAFTHQGSLPGNRFLSGIKSYEIRGQRYNQLRMDDTPGQISTQLASEHGHSQLNLGHLRHPRRDGAADARGEGAELRSDEHIALRAAKGMLITA